MKEKLSKCRDYLLEHSKFSYPVILIVAVAITVFVALRFNGKEETESKMESLEVLATYESSEQDIVENVNEELVVSDQQELVELVNTYYSAYAAGDTDTICGLFDIYTETECLITKEMCKYISAYPVVEVYTRPGPTENSYLGYVYFTTQMEGYEDTFPGLQVFYIDTKVDGTLYFKNLKMISEEEVEFINSVGEQDDVKELSNRVEVEFGEMSANNEQMLKYAEEVAIEVKNNVGKLLAQSISGEETQPNPDETQEPAVGEEGENNADDGEYVSGPIMAKATDTVNVRSSDSINAGKLGKVPAGATVEVLEQKVNGWSHIRYESIDGYIKSEYLKVAQQVKPGEVIGQVTANSNVNVRMEPNQNSDKIGIISGGEKVDLLERLGEWYKIGYNNTVGYVKAEFVTEE